MTATKEQIEKWRGRDYSWSQHSSFLWSPADWFSKYVLGLEERATPELVFGKAFAEAAETGTPLAPLTMLRKMEHPFKVPFEDFTLIGYADTFCDITFKEIGEYKTGVKPWDQKRVDGHGQLTMYALMNYIQNKIRPEDVRLFLEWIPTRQIPRDNGDMTGFEYDIVFRDETPEPIYFETKRSMVDVLTFGSEIKRIRGLMEQYIESRV